MFEMAEKLLSEDLDHNVWISLRGYFLKEGYRLDKVVGGVGGADGGVIAVRTIWKRTINFSWQKPEQLHSHG